MSKNRFEAFAHQLILSVGWRRRAWALAAGAVGALAMPPLGAFPLAALSLTAAVWLIDGSIGQPGASRLRSRVSAAVEAAQTGWWFGFGFFLIGLWWLGSAFLVEADQFAWALPLGVVGLPAVLALYTALGFFLARLIWSTGALRVFALAAGLALSEWLRSVLFTGFPWNEWGMALGGRLYLAQAASVVGLHGLTIICVAIAAAPATLADALGGWRKAPTALAVLALAGLTFFGVARVETGEVAMTPNVRLRLMQPNLP
ncbi:MAG TPA: apolipoprotein N-acyltransferase, partial [Beijerinckiaceae bacterium]